MAKIVAAALNIEYYSTGNVFRQLAKEQGMTLEEFSRYAETNPEIDQQLDSTLVDRAREGNMVVEGQLVGYLLRDVPGCLKVLLIASEEIRLQRMCERDDENSVQKLMETLGREKSEQERFLNFYGIDLHDPTVILDIYDLVINTTRWAAEEVASVVIEAAKNMTDAC
ncbi:MAG TPA: cytidylate kinase family protein [Candidatus Lokiarchaeia archaeon]|nr:cytidylate kinase family protein [Candidatus Lokiarchaeia archaeon]